MKVPTLREVVERGHPFRCTNCKEYAVTDTPRTLAGLDTISLECVECGELAYEGKVFPHVEIGMPTGQMRYYHEEEAPNWTAVAEETRDVDGGALETCSHCGEGFVAVSDVDWVEGTDGELYCDVDCYNEALA